MNRQQHPDQLRQQARHLYERHGSSHAAQQLGIPQRTVNHWARQEGWQRRLATARPVDQRIQPATGARTPEAAKTPLPGRPRLAWRIREELWAQLDQLKAYREGRKPRDAKDTAVTVGILLDKLLILEQREQGSGQDQDAAVVVGRLAELIDAAEGRPASG